MVGTSSVVISCEDVTGICSLDGIVTAGVTASGVVDSCGFEAVDSSGFFVVSSPSSVGFGGGMVTSPSGFDEASVVIRSSVMLVTVTSVTSLSVATLVKIASVVPSFGEVSVLLWKVVKSLVISVLSSDFSVVENPVVFENFKVVMSGRELESKKVVKNSVVVKNVCEVGTNEEEVWTVVEVEDMAVVGREVVVATVGRT